MQDIKVTIGCITFNQATYISEAIDSFLMQETTFDYEIIIHDDASTDGTAEIVKKYADKFPDKIIAILQEENQYSKKVKISKTFIYPIARGKYFALCEGDDFWTDKKKLQKQYDYMEANPLCSMCIHDALIVSADRKIEFPSCVLSERECDFNIEDAIMGLGIKAVTNSFFYRMDMLKQETPNFVKLAPAGDFALPIRSALTGYIHYIPEQMSAHRMLAKNSFSATMGTGSKSIERWKKFYDRQEASLNSLDEYTDYKYSNLIKKSLEEQKFRNYIMTRNKEKLKEEPYVSMLKNLRTKEKFKYYFPLVFNSLQRMYYMLLRVKTMFKHNW